MVSFLHRLECSRLSVPIDWRNPASGNVDILVVRSPAKQREKRRGTIFFDSGMSYNVVLEVPH